MEGYVISLSKQREPFVHQLRNYILHDAWFWCIDLLLVIFLSVLLQSNVENLSPQVIRSVSKELADLVTDAPEGIRIITNEEDITDIQAVIDGPGKTYSIYIQIIIFWFQNIFTIYFHMAFADLQIIWPGLS